MNGGTYFPEDEASEDVNLREEPKKKVEIDQSKSPCSATLFGSYKQPDVRALQELKYGEEPFLEYGSSYGLLE